MTALADSFPPQRVSRQARRVPSASAGVVAPIPRRTVDRRRPPGRRSVAVPAAAGRVVACQVRVRRIGWLRLVLATALVAGCVVGFGLLAGSAGSAAPVPERTTVIYVESGQTLWSIAQEVAPGSRPAAVRERIRELNDLDGSALQVGEPLRVPDGRGR